MNHDHTRDSNVRDRTLASQRESLIFLVSSMLNLHANSGVDAEVRTQLQEPSSKVMAIARAREPLNASLRLVVFSQHAILLASPFECASSRLAGRTFERKLS
jgi:two-component sensor histidine kinase